MNNIFANEKFSNVQWDSETVFGFIVIGIIVLGVAWLFNKA